MYQKVERSRKIGYGQGRSGKITEGEGSLRRGQAMSGKVKGGLIKITRGGNLYTSRWKGQGRSNTVKVGQTRSLEEKAACSKVKGSQARSWKEETACGKVK